MPLLLPCLIIKHHQGVIRWQVPYCQLAHRRNQISASRPSRPVYRAKLGLELAFPVSSMAMDQYLYIPFLGGWTSIYQLFWGSLGTRVLTHPPIIHQPKVIIQGSKANHSCPFSCPHLETNSASIRSLEGPSSPTKARENIPIAAHRPAVPCEYPQGLWPGRDWNSKAYEFSIVFTCRFRVTRTTDIFCWGRSSKSSTKCEWATQIPETLWYDHEPTIRTRA